LEGFNTLKNPAGSHFGFEHNELTKQRMSAKAKLRVISPEQRAKIAEANRGKIISQEQRDAISKANTGKVRSLESREKVRQFRLKYVIPQSTKDKMSKSAKTRPPISEETRAKLVAKSKGFRHTEETKEKLRLLKTGLKHTPEAA